MERTNNNSEISNQLTLSKVLGRIFLKAIVENNTLVAEAILNEGVDLNYRDSSSGMTALHYVAASGFRPLLRILVKNENCNHLILDNKARVAAEVAFTSGSDPAIGRLLMKHFRRQYHVQKGIDSSLAEQSIKPNAP